MVFGRWEVDARGKGMIHAQDETINYNRRKIHGVHYVPQTVDC
jgi:hypothetical protein